MGRGSDTRRKILVTDPLSQKGIELLEEKAEVDLEIDLEQEELVEIINKYEALIVRSGTTVDAEVIAAGAPNLKVIGRAGTGVDNIDLDAATNNGVLVVNTPGANTVSVAEHTIALMLALSRNITGAHMALKDGRWERKKYRGREVKGKTLGIIGLGRAGGEVAKRARALEMQVVACDKYISERKANKLGVKLVELDELLATSDYISLHVPLTRETEYMIDSEQFANMKDEVYIINCARGKIVNEAALYEALKSGKVAGAALDVFEEEPLRDSPLRELENTVLVPHLGASTREAMDKVAVEVAHQVLNVLEGELAENTVNIPSVSDRDFSELKPYFPLAEKLGRLSAQWVKGYIKQIRVSYCGKLAELKVELLTTYLLKGLLDPILAEPVNLVNAPVIAGNRGINIVESIRKNDVDYSNLIELEVETDREVNRVAGSLFRRNDQRLVLFEDYPIDTPLDGIMLLAYHRDRPGIIGQVGTILGRHNINIAKMQVGRKQRGGRAVMVLGVDAELPDEAYERILQIDGVEESKMIKL